MQHDPTTPHPPDADRATTESLSRTSGARLARAGHVLGLTILAHPARHRVGERALLPQLEASGNARLSRLEPPFAAPRQETSPTPLGHRRLSRRPLLLEATGDADRPGVRLRRGQGPNGTEVDGEPLGDECFLGSADLERGVVLTLGGRVVLLLQRLQAQIDPALPRFGLIGESPPIQVLRRRLRKVGNLDVPVLLRGETGTGKELAARALHDAGPRRRGPFVVINMAALPPSLAAAELFGAARGAFTGAARAREGYFARADGGTLFLDEVGEMPAEVQVLLLRCLETGEVQPLGAAAPRRVDVRLVAATDANLEAAVDEGRFRAPLLHRLGGFVLHLPPLRERREDLGRLAYRFIEEELEALGAVSLLEVDPPWLRAELVARLARFDWPGNVRQLRNVARRLAIVGSDAAHAEIDLELENMLAEPSPRRRGSTVSTAEITEHQMIEALRSERWRPSAAARRLGIPRPSLYHWMRRSARVRLAGELGRDEIKPLLERHGYDLARIAAELEVSERGLRRRLSALGL